MKQILSVVERLIGRRTLWRIGRAAYFFSRRDVNNSIENNGERDLQRRLARHFKGREFIVFDVGANVGDWSRSMIEAAPTGLRLFAFEPAPESFERLRAILNGHVATQFAVGEREGEASFSIVGASAGTNSLAQTAGDSIAVSVTTVSAFAAAQGLPRVDFLKSDVEGFDLSVIKGALPLLRDGGVGIVQFEYNWRWKESRTYLADVFDLMSALPYTVGKVIPGAIELYDTWHPELERFVEGNYALIRNDMLEVVGAIRGEFDRSNTYA